MTKNPLFSGLRALLLIAPVALAACTSADMQMPTGYTYHNQVYRAPPGPEASPPAKLLKAGETAANGMIVMGSEEIAMSGSPDANGQYSNETLCAAADDLVARLLKNFGRPMEPVLVPPTSPLTGCLSAALQRGQVPLAANPGDGPFVLDHAVSNGMASITFMSNHDPVTSEAGNYAAGSEPAPESTPESAPATLLQ